MDIDIHETPAVDSQLFFDLEPLVFDYEMPAADPLAPFPVAVKEDPFMSLSDDTMNDDASDPLRSDVSASAGSFVEYDPVMVDSEDILGLAEPPMPLFDEPEAPVPMEDVAPLTVLAAPQDGSAADSYHESRDSDSEGASSRRGRKRKGAPVAEANEKRARRRFEPGVLLNKEELTNLTAEELEEYARHIQGSNLSSSEKNEIRKQLRLVKNRESAQASRLRKKNYIDDLEGRVAQLQAENSSLRGNVSSLNNENNQLKSEVVYLKGVVNSGGLSKVLSAGASFFSKFSQQQKQQQQEQGKPALNARTTGVVLMVLLFSFGLLFNSQSANKASPVVLPTREAGGRIMHASFKPTSESRDVLNEMPTERIRQLVEKQRAMPDSSSHKVIEERGSAATTNSNIRAASAKGKEEPSKANAAELPVVMGESDWKANTTYLLCPSVHKLSPPSAAQHSTADNASLPMQIAFLIPPDSLGAGEASAGTGAAKSMLEVTCQVVDVVSRPIAAAKK